MLMLLEKYAKQTCTYTEPDKSCMSTGLVGAVKLPEVLIA